MNSNEIRSAYGRQEYQAIARRRRLETAIAIIGLVVMFGVMFGVFIMAVTP